MKAGRTQTGTGKGPDFQDAFEGGKHEGMASANLPIDKVQQLQRALYVAAKRQPQRRFHALYDRIFREDVLREAWNRVRANRGSAGVDGVTIRQVEDRIGVEVFLAQIGAALRNKRYRPQPVRRHYIPKGTAGKLRPLGIPTIRDRVVQAAARLVLEPIFEADFLPSSYGFRPKRTQGQALDAIRQAQKRGFLAVVDLDIQGYFDHIDHDRLLALMARRVSDRRVLKLVRLWLKAGVMDAGTVHVQEEGTPQGGVISPLLANIYLHEMDRQWSENRPTQAVQVRYADDMVFLCGRRDEAERTLAWACDVLAGLGLEVNAEKTRIADLRAGDGFDFLGFHHRLTRPPAGDQRRRVPSRWPSSKSMNRLRDRVRETLSAAAARGLPPAEAAAELNPILRGWANYFRQGESFYKFGALDRYLREAMMLYDNRRRPTHGRRWQTHPYAWYRSLGLLRLTDVFRRRAAIECAT